MAVKLSQKENFLRMAKGECPEYIPMYSYGPNPYNPNPSPNGMCGPSILQPHRGPEGGTDIWGVHYVTTKETGYSALPEPNNFILKDIRKWRDVIKAPDISHVDWEMMAKKDLEMTAQMGIDRTETALSYSMHVGYFQQLMSFMGFTEGLCALYEEPEEVKALLSYMSDFYCEVEKNCIDYYEPDMVGITDDTATWNASFISLDMYRDMFKECHAKEAQFGVDRGLPVEMHNCGKCEDFIDDWRDFGVKYWNPAQVCNDCDAIKKKYGNDLVICGGWDAVGALADPDINEEAYKQSIINTMDRLAVGGGYVFAGWIFADPDDENINQKNRWMTEIVLSYGETFYK